MVDSRARFRGPGTANSGSRLRIGYSLPDAVKSKGRGCQARHPGISCPRDRAGRIVVRKHSVFIVGLVALFASAAPAAPKDPSKGMQWRKDIRAALSEAEDRGVCLMIYLTRDD